MTVDIHTFVIVKYSTAYCPIIQQATWGLIYIISHTNVSHMELNLVTQV